MADDVEEVATALGLQDYVPVGHSMGGKSRRSSPPEARRASQAWCWSRRLRLSP
jgi:pimeloyl-ACP methyl ester carboxylesterase